VSFLKLHLSNIKIFIMVVLSWKQVMSYDKKIFVIVRLHGHCH